jgi:hypothetical protein
MRGSLTEWTFHDGLPSNGLQSTTVPAGQLSKLNFRMLARRGHQRCHCNEEGFGTLSRQLGNDEGSIRPSNLWPVASVRRWQPQRLIG